MNFRSFIHAGLAALAVGAAAFATPASAGATLGAIRQRGTLKCAVQGPSNPGFGVPDNQGRWQGFNVDLCRAVAIAIFGNGDKIEIAALTTQTRFPALTSGEVDLLTNNTTYVQLRETQLRFNFPAITFYDGQGILVPKKLNVTQVRQLDGATVCVQPGTTTELNLADYFRSNNLNYEVVSFKTNEEGVKAFEAGRCDSFTTDSSGLAAERLKFANPNDFVILPELISREPLGPAVRRGDENFAAIVRWTHYAMLNAEDLGVTRANVAELARSTQSPEIRRLLGLDGKFGEAMGLPNDWAQRIIRHVGNYGEVFERNVGSGSRLGLPRGLNALWSQGGQQYPYPIR